MSSIIISRADAGRTVAAVLQAHCGLPAIVARTAISQGQVKVDGRPCRNEVCRLRAGQRVTIARVHCGKRASTNSRPEIHFLDDDIVVVDKPTGLTTMRHADEEAEFGHRGRRFLPPTLADILPGLIAARLCARPGYLRAVHRLDRDTSGLVVFARSPAAERHLGRQFREHTVDRRYLAIVRGPAHDERIESVLARDRGDGRRGTAPTSDEGKLAVTHVRVLERLGTFSLVECRLETGRTHQVRIHLGENGTPLVGERVYDRPLHGSPYPDGGIDFPRPALHAATLGLEHPRSGKRITWTARLPTDMKQVLDKLRRIAGKSSG